MGEECHQVLHTVVSVCSSVHHKLTTCSHQLFFSLARGSYIETYQMFFVQEFLNFFITTLTTSFCIFPLDLLSLSTNKYLYERAYYHPSKLSDFEMALTYNGSVL